VEAAPETDYERYNIYFAVSRLHNLLDAVPQAQDFLFGDLTIVPLGESRLPDLLCYMPKFEQFKANQALCGLLLAAFLGETAECARHNAVIRHNTGDTYIRDVLKYIDEHIAGNLTLPEIARAHHVCLTKLCQDFKRITMLTPAQYIRRARIARAKILLRQDTQSVLQTALNCGFSNESHFITVFKRATGTTPGAYARAHHGFC